MRAWLLAIALVVLALVFGMTKSAVQKIRVAVIKPAGDVGIALEQCPGVVAFHESPAAFPEGDALRAALAELLGLYRNPLFQGMNFVRPIEDGALDFEKVRVTDGVANVYLVGDRLWAGNYCEDRYLEAQFYFTVTQFPGVNGVKVYVNGDLMGEGKSGWRYFTDRYNE
ncbi:MAG TPA: GerMN domain-containing protein [Candidatus Diapherotrites archaeon]|uniref:GerMN domain-containing protein n=1 Tax=Candidatus Iainarchaeum sp. TaxID=3101447 RepID=A0A7J4JP06_9ARCH|nr:GerMN domain-containing protein [Candidatus Diapherotrites archaeon]HIH16936.1 GerMN domain-containing protein [Candidatus Diapherotrites archaeon]